MPPVPAGVVAIIESSHAARRWRRHGHKTIATHINTANG